MSAPHKTSSMTINTGSTFPQTYFQTGSQYQDPSQSHLNFSGHPESQINSPYQDPYKGDNHFQNPTPYYTSATNFQSTEENDNYNHHHNIHNNQNTVNPPPGSPWTTPSTTTAVVQQQQSTTAHQGPVGGHVDVNRKSLLEEIWLKIDARVALTFALLISISTVFCILTEDEVPLSYSLACISILSLTMFIKTGW